MIFTKGAHQSAKFQTFNCSGEISPNLYFYRLLLLKVYKISAKTYRSWIMILKSGKKLKKNRFFWIWWILIWALKRLKKLHFDWSLLCKVYNVWHKKVLRRYISWHWRVMQNLKWFGKSHEEIGKFSSKHLKVSKLVLSYDPFVQSRKCMS